MVDEDDAVYKSNLVCPSVIVVEARSPA